MTNLPSMVRDNIVVWYEVAREKVKLVANQIPWNNRTEDNLAIEQNLPKDDEFYNLLEDVLLEDNSFEEHVSDSDGLLENKHSDDLLEDWAKYDKQLRERWTKHVHK